MNKELLVAVLFLIVGTGLFAQSEIQKYHFVGGMFYGSGYYSMTNSYTDATGFTSCLGGRLSFFAGSKFLIGGRGNSVTLRYNEPSYYRIGSGGLAASYVLNKDPLLIFIGVFGGGGRIRNIHAISKQGDYYLTDISSDSFFFVAPEITVSYRLTDKIGLTFIADYYLTNKSKIKINQGLNVCGGLVFFR
ncbi:MAG: hypothetical protein CVU05_10660 [Bacteroidetes bacterium HGW-Bacteroidetes-21]|jgi:hypothetical protein|nr:MAG: hypothetical protein CVU05_10660 [Bacteroidetes bacterium HGW-Bacteroidetes-21]